MTNPFVYYTFTEIVYALLSLLLIASVLIAYSLYYLKKKAGLFLLLTLVSPILLSSLVFIFSKSLNINPTGFNAVSILWFPIFFSLTHTLYNITRLRRSKTDTKTFEFEFLKQIKAGNIVSAILLVLVALSTVALLPTSYVITVFIGLGITIISILINTFIIIKRI
jgi:hypothetical protein